MAERVSQLVSELLGAGVPITRISQIIAETYGSGTPTTNVSQIISELYGAGVPSTRVSQIIAEILGQHLVSTRVSQLIVEALIPNIEVFMPLVYPDLPGLGYSVHWRPKGYHMPTAVMETGARIDLGWSDAPLHEFELTYDFLRGQGFTQGSTEFRTFMGFFLALNGNLGRFLFPNPDDRSVTRQLIATTDGVAHQWSLIRTFGIGEYVGTENVGYVDLTLPFNAYLGSRLLAPSEYTVDQTDPVDQKIILTSTPAGSQDLYVDMSYFYYCNFPDGTMDFEKFMNNLWTIKSVKFESNRAGT